MDSVCVMSEMPRVKERGSWSKANQPRTAGSGWRMASEGEGGQDDSESKNAFVPRVG